MTAWTANITTILNVLLLKGQRLQLKAHNGVRPALPEGAGDVLIGGWQTLIMKLSVRCPESWPGVFLVGHQPDIQPVWLGEV